MNDDCDQYKLTDLLNAAGINAVRQVHNGVTTLFISDSAWIFDDTGRLLRVE